ncbi:YihY/virulence factor BrkB family protein [Streptomyces sp. YIM 98790]|uniref:YihY/virulence factor BrkB family protein n=1 Tax=Streptomyces sp. YIM 98790 TaxID=2689077 RepID=UPI0028BD1C8D|nr:YihY/virulence factor BrkB family protein [Streptomyces sp. YIM 98790]
MAVRPPPPEYRSGHGAQAGRWRDRRAALLATPVSMWRDDVTDWAAALTYYAVLSVLPALVCAISVTGLTSPEATGSLVEHVTAWVPAEAGATLRQALSDRAEERAAALLVAIGSGTSALWSAVSYLAVFRRALHGLYRVTDHRTPWRQAPRILATAVVLLLLMTASVTVLVAPGALAGLVGDGLGVRGAEAVDWRLLRWPVLVCAATLMVLVLFGSGPRQARRLRHLLPGIVLAGVCWLAASAGFAAFASGLGTYSRLYGSLAGTVVFLIWMWMTNLALLAGAQFAVELGRIAARRADTDTETDAETDRDADVEAGPGRVPADRRDRPVRPRHQQP